ncbi:hypothetical protein [Paracoccus sp. (in: a-proteobacteria)]|uniref:hypothetical protein n=1 Tax=Paracoccus sp. TaxID=267 RepID=UPI003A840E95
MISDAGARLRQADTVRSSIDLAAEQLKKIAGKNPLPPKKSGKVDLADALNTEQVQAIAEKLARAARRLTATK